MKRLAPVAVSIPLYAITLVLLVTHIKWVVESVRAVVPAWHWFYLFSPSVDVYMTTLVSVIFIPIRALILLTAMVSSKEKLTLKEHLSFIAIWVALLFGGLLLAHVINWGSFFVDYDIDGTQRLRIIPFIPWPNRPFTI
jgi:hypothetical protein